MFLQQNGTAKLGIMGVQTFILKDKDGNIKRLWNENRLGKFLFKRGIDIRIPFVTGFYDAKKVVKNLITYAGYAAMASRLNGAGSEAAFTYLGVGTGTTAANVANTGLETPITDSGLERAAATCTRITTAQTNDTAKLDKTWSVTGSKAVTECVAFNAATDGVALGRQVFSAINVANGDSLQIIYTFQILV
jgi:hypothetical protein